MLLNLLSFMQSHAVLNKKGCDYRPFQTVDKPIDTLADCEKGSYILSI